MSKIASRQYLGPSSLLPLGSICAMAFVPLLSQAHHGVLAHYDIGRTIDISGVVERIRMINPHSFIYVQASDDNGNPVTWSCELPGRNLFEMMGIPEDIEAGEQIRLVASPHRRDSSACYTRTLFRADGSFVSTSGAFGGTRTSAAAPSRGGIEDTWLLMNAASVLTKDNYFRDKLTPAGRAAMEAYDPTVDDPARRCSGSSPQRVWGSGPNEISREGDRVIIRHEFNDTVRTVHLDLETHPEDVPRSEMGHSIGRYEDDGATLVVEVARFSEGLLIPHLQEAGINTGIPHSEELVYTESYSVNEADHLVYLWTAEDPVYYSEPLTGVWLFSRSSVPVREYNCVPD